MLFRNAGGTRSERLLARLAEYAFLRLWSFPSLYRDQSGAKEICDLIVAFDNDVILFSDKEIVFPAGDLATAWSRWERRAITASLSQLVGARRWLTQHPDRVFLDRACQHRFPFRIDPRQARFHLVSVSTGARDRCLTETGAPSLTLEGRSHTPRPFVVSAQHDNDVVLFLDETSLPILMGELDTAADFVSYLNAREEFIRSGMLRSAQGEHNLLAAYLRTRGSSAPKFRPAAGPTTFGWELWPSLEASAHFQQQRRHLLPSYAWDHLIETFTTSVLNGTAIHGDPNDPRDHEPALRLLAHTTRAERRELALNLSSLIRATTGEEARFRAIRLASRPDTMFAMIVAPHLAYDDESEYREDRAGALADYCLSIKSVHKDIRRVAGLAVAPEYDRFTQDAFYLDASSWTEDLQREAELARQETGYYRLPSIKASLLAGGLVAPEHRRRERNRRKREARSRSK